MSAAVRVKCYSGNRPAEKVERCRRCGADICFTAGKSGKRYPCEVMRTPSESFTRSYNMGYCPWKPHNREACNARIAQTVSSNNWRYQEQALHEDFERDVRLAGFDGFESMLDWRDEVCDVITRARGGVTPAAARQSEGRLA